MKITLIKRATHWKDQAAGWHQYRVDYVCSVCGRNVKETIYGEIYDIRDSFLKTGLVCDKCREAQDMALEVESE